MKASKYEVFYLLTKIGLRIDSLKFYYEDDLLTIETPVGPLQFEYYDSDVYDWDYNDEDDGDIYVDVYFTWEDRGIKYEVFAKGEGSYNEFDELKWDSIDKLLDIHQVN